MSEGGTAAEDPGAADPGGRAGGASGAEAVGDALRSAVERTLAATAGSATETRERAQGLLDDVVRRSQSARDRVARSSEEASTRLAEAISDLRAADDEGLGELAARLDALERRLAAVEAEVKDHSSPQVEVEGIPDDADDQRDPGDSGV